MTASQTIRVHGYPIEVIGDSILSTEENELLVEGLRSFEPRIIKILSEGRGEAEPPLKIEIEKYDESKHKDKFGVKDAGLYRTSLNRMEIYLHAPEVSRQRYKNIVTHEVGHAIDDFAVVSGVDRRIENGSALNNFFLRKFFQNDPHSFPRSFEEFMLAEGYASRKETPGEVIANVISYLVDPRRHEKMRFYFKNHFQKECIDVGDRCLSPATFEGQDILIQSVNIFLANFPLLIDINPEEQ